MKHGDLSNTAGITIGFRCVGLLVKYRETTFTDRVLNAFMGKTRRAEIDESVRSYMEHLYRDTEYNVDLIIEEDEYNADLKGLLDSMPFNRVVLTSKLSQISNRLLVGDLTLYVDDDETRRSLVNNRHAVSFNELTQYIRGGLNSVL